MLDEVLKLDIQTPLQKLTAWIILYTPRLFLTLLLFFLLHKVFSIAERRWEGRLAVWLSKQQALPTESEKRIRTLLGITRKAGIALLWAVAFTAILKQLGIDVGPILATAGIFGLAVSFGAQNLVRDFISGIFILFEDQIRVGDVANINGTGGLVEEINLRTTILRDLSGTVHIFPNGQISTISNLTKDWSAVVFDIGVAYKEDTDRVTEIMLDVAEGIRKDAVFGPNILEPMEIFGVDAFGNSEVVIKARLKTKPIQQWTVGREYRRRLKKAFEARGIEIPFPHRTLYFGPMDEALQVLLRKEGEKAGQGSVVEA